MLFIFLKGIRGVYGINELGIKVACKKKSSKRKSHFTHEAFLSIIKTDCFEVLRVIVIV